MANVNTKIEWTDATWSPVTGCTKVSQGCKNCYAERLAPKVFAGQMVVDYYNEIPAGLPPRPRRFTDVMTHPNRLDAPLHWKKPRRVFVNSMSDLFHESIHDEFLLAVWSVMEATPHHTYQVLSKRPNRMKEWLGRWPEPERVAQPEYERRAIPNYDGYYADTDGIIWSDRRGELKPLTPGIETDKGHSHVTLHDGKGFHQEKVHRLVLITFDGEPLDGEECRHLDGDASNNRLNNLKWGTRAENSEDRTRHGNAVTRHKLEPINIAHLRIAMLQGGTSRNVGDRFGVSKTQALRIASGDSWPPRPLPNVWLGVSVEDQATADERIPLLLQTPAAVRFISAEPLIGPVNVGPYLTRDHLFSLMPGFKDPLPGLNWVIAGGESGPKARPSHPDWFRSLRDQCGAAGVPFFFKQWGEWAPGQLERRGDMRKVGKKSAGRLLDGREHSEYPG